MMFNNKFVCSIKTHGKILKEFKDVVKLPFGTEFTILLKNLNTVRAQVSVAIDGSDVTENVYLVINPNSELELTRYIKNGNLNKGNCFKFIERTEGIENHRGIKAEDGIIRVEFQFEKPSKKYVTRDGLEDKLDEIKRTLDRKADKGDVWRQPYYYTPLPQPAHTWPWGTLIGTAYQSTSSDGNCTGAVSNAVFTSSSSTAGNAASTVTTNSVGTTQNVAKSSFSGTLRLAGDSGYRSFCAQPGELFSADVCDAGITVPGSESDQKFSTTASFDVEDEKHVIVLKLVGTSATGVQYVAPVTVKAKPKCQTCGRVNKATSKFCSECGTALVIL